MLHGHQAVIRFFGQFQHAANADLYGRVQIRLFKSYFNTKWKNRFAQAEAGICLDYWSNGNFRQVNGLAAYAYLEIQHNFQPSANCLSFRLILGAPSPFRTSPQISSAKFSSSFAWRIKKRI